MRVKLYFDNKEGKEELLSYLMNTIGQSKLSDRCVLTDIESQADIVLDLEDLSDKEQIAEAAPAIIEQIFHTYQVKKKRVLVQPNQKKIRRRKK